MLGSIDIKGVVVLVKSLQYYVTGHTAKGFVNYLKENIQGIRKIITLKHPSNALKTDIFKKLLNHYEASYDVEVFLSSNGEDHLDGFIIKELSFGVITDDLMDKGVETEFFDLEKMVPVSEQAWEIVSTIEASFQKAYDHFRKALLIHDDLEAVYIKEMDFSKADKLAEEFIHQNLGKFQVKNESSRISRRLFGTNTYQGAVNIVPQLLERVSHRYYLKGRAGTGKSTFMRAVISSLEKLGMDMEIYHCSFDPESIDMVLVPEADFCIFDSTSPHEFFPEAGQGTIIDLYEKTVTPGTDERFSKSIDSITNYYKNEITKAMTQIKVARKFQIALEKEISYRKEDVETVRKKIMEIHGK